MGTENHPVWTLYDRLRSTCLSCKYYGRRLQEVERTNLVLEVILAATAPTSAVAGLFFWQTPMGELAWKGFGVIAAFVAVVKPLLHLPKKIKEYESMQAAYRILDGDLRELKTAVEQKQRFDATMQAELRKIVQREKTLNAKNPDPVENARIRRLCEAEVVRELPTEGFFVPKGE